MIDDFIDRKHGRKAVAYDLPELKEILEETYGVIVYQEQVMQISNRLAGYSLGRSRPPAPRHGQEEGRGDGQPARPLRRGRAEERASRRRRSKRSSI